MNRFSLIFFCIFIHVSFNILNGLTCGSVNSFRTINLKNKEVESFSKAFFLEEKEACSALNNLKVFLNVHECLSFEILKGGDCNNPVLVIKSEHDGEFPLVVLKHEPSGTWAEKRMKALNEMREAGFQHLPRILKNKNGNYLVCLGNKLYSCIEYLKPDADQSRSIEQMFIQASRFHYYSDKVSFKENLRQSALDNYSDKSVSHLDPQLIKWDPSVFESEAWEVCVKCAHFFSSQSFQKIYNHLPIQLIHADITPNNTIISDGQYFLIDLDTVKTDVRLLDFATFAGWSFLEDYLKLSKDHALSDCIQNYYGTLEDQEKKYFSLIVLFVRCKALCWSLQELRQGLFENNLQKEKNFCRILLGTIREINEIYKHIPEVREIMSLTPNP